MSNGRICSVKEDFVYGLLGLTMVQIPVTYNTGLQSALDTFYSTCINKGDKSILFGFGTRIQIQGGHWQTCLDENVDWAFYRQPLYQDEENINNPSITMKALHYEKSSMKNVATPLRLELKGYRAASLLCVYKENDSALDSSTSSRIYKLIQKGIEMKFDAWDCYKMFDFEEQDTVTMNCVLIWISIIGNEELDIKYVTHLFDKMKQSIEEYPTEFSTKRNELWEILSNPEEGERKGSRWKQGNRVLQIIEQCEGLENMKKQTLEYARGLVRIIFISDDTSFCRLALGIVEHENTGSIPVCLMLAKSEEYRLNASTKENNMALAIPTGCRIDSECTKEQLQLCLIGIPIITNDNDSTNIVAHCVGVVAPRIGLIDKLIDNDSTRHTTITII